MKEEFQEIYDLWNKEAYDYRRMQNRYDVFERIESAQNVDELIDALDSIKYSESHDVNLNNILEKIAEDYPQTREKVEHILLKRKLAQSIPIKSNTIEQIDKIQMANTIDEIIDLTISANSDVKVEVLRTIKENYPDKAKKVDLPLQKSLVTQCIEYYDEDENKFLTLINQSQSLDEIFSHVVKEGSSLHFFNMFQALQNIRTDYPQQSERVQAIIDDFAKVEKYENLSTFYMNIFDIMEAQPERYPEYIGLVKDALSSDKNDEKSLKNIYILLNVVRYDHNNMFIARNPMRSFLKEHPEDAVHFANLYVQALNSDKNTQDTLSLAAEMLPMVIEDIPEQSMDLIKKFYDAKAEQYAEQYIDSSIRKALKINPEFAKEYLDFVRDNLNSADTINNADYSPYLIEIMKKYAWSVVKDVIEAGVNVDKQYHATFVKCLVSEPYEQSENLLLQLIKNCNDKDELVRDIAAQSNRFDEYDRFCLFEKIIRQKLCSPETGAMLVKTAYQYGNSDYSRVTQSLIDTYPGHPAIAEVFEQIKTDKRNKKIIDEVLKEYPAGEKIEALIRLADSVVKTKDEEKISKFKDLLFSQGEQYIFNIDKLAMDWFVNNGTPKDLEALNNLSQFYGIKTELDNYWTVDPAQNAALRIRFDGGYSEIGAIQYDKYLGEEVSNPHYYRMLSDAYRDFRPDYSRDYKPSEYNLHENAAFETLAKHGVKMPIKMLQQAFAEVHMPPETAKQLNATDLQHLLVNYVQHRNGCEHDNWRDEESSDILAERIKEERRGDRVPMGTISSKAPVSIREKLWKAYARNGQLVDFVSDDWSRLGIDVVTIHDIWENARETGAPVVYYGNKASHYGIRNTLHHAKPLRIGGTNDQSIIITNDIREAGYEDRFNFSEGDYYTVYSEGGYFEINSHDPFHHYDNPCVYLYLKSNGKLTVKDEPDGRMKKRMMVVRYPSAKHAEDERIVYYGGPCECSCAIMDKKGNIRSASYDFWKDDTDKSRSQDIEGRALDKSGSEKHGEQKIKSGTKNGSKARQL